MRKNTSRRDIELIVVGDDGERQRRSHRDTLATEEPLEIRVVPASAAARRASEVARRVSVTMRTPGEDFELAAGFLYAESVIEAREDIDTMRFCVDPSVDGAQQYNVVNVLLAPGVVFDSALLQRNFYTTSSCGVCGKASIAAVRAAGCPVVRGDRRVSAETVLALTDRLRARQAVFDRTGGLHAAALFTLDGELVGVREDIGRHNAMDKLIGARLLAGEFPLPDSIAMVSGRLSFELVQKAARAGITILVGVSAPSSLAVELADDAGMTLIGFLREGRFNVYTGGERVITPRTSSSASTQSPMPLPGTSDG